MSVTETKPKYMLCFGGWGPPWPLHKFLPVIVDDEHNGDYCCEECGWYQTSTAGGAAEICTSATWYEDSWEAGEESGRALYNRLRTIAINGGYDVPEHPPIWVPNEEE